MYSNEKAKQILTLALEIEGLALLIQRPGESGSELYIARQSIFSSFPDGGDGRQLYSRHFRSDLSGRILR